MHEHELPTIGADAAVRAMKNGATFTQLPFSFCTAGGTAFTHSLQTKRGTVYRVSRQVAKALQAVIQAAPADAATQINQASA